MKNFIGQKAIDFTLPAVLGNGKLTQTFNLYENIKDKNALLFFYPMDFTFVCPSELIALNNRFNDFANRNVEIIGISLDSHFVHNAWRQTSIENGGIGNDIKYSLASDIKKEIMSFYGLLDYNSGVAYRGTIIIDTNKIIRAQHIHDFPIGRNMDEYIRLFDAIAFHNKYGNVCQAGWVKGDEGIIPSSDGISKFLASKSKDL